jgi:CBS domain-containing protein
MAATTAQPAPSLVARLRQSLAPHEPFASMRDEDLDVLLLNACVRYFMDGDVVLAPSTQRPSHAFVVRQGLVVTRAPNGSAPAWERGVGEMFPLSALLEQRGVTHVYSARGDTFLIAFPVATFDALLQRSAAFADFCRRRVAQLVDLSHTRLQGEFAAAVTESAHPSTALADIVRGAPVTGRESMPIGEALRLMESRRIGSIVMVDAGERPLGIFTRQDVVGRVVLPQVALDTPLSSLTTRPVVTLPRESTASEAALEMTRRGIRHIVVVDATGRTSGVVSERDLFALQRLSVREIASALRRAPDVDALVQHGADIRALSHSLVAQGVASDALTRMISSLNDQLLQRLIEVVAPAHALDGIRYCWIGMGSEGRSEQTIATDQDNGIVFQASGDEDALRARLLPFARDVNQALDAIGYPLCKGGVMAMNERWCASLDEWQRAFRGWIERGDPQSLLDAAIFFDFRSLYGDATLAHTLRHDVAMRAKATPRFLKQMADNALMRRPPLNWFGEVSGVDVGGLRDAIDLKLSGTALFVDAARILALSSGVTETSTASRLTGVGTALGILASETRAWVASFEYLQLLRLRTQYRRASGALAASANPNAVPLDDLSTLDQRIVKEAMREARRLQQRLELDYPG